MKRRHKANDHANLWKFSEKGEWLTSRVPAMWDEWDSALSALLSGGHSPPDVDTFVEGYRVRLQGWATRQEPHLNVSGRTFQASWMSDIILLNINTLNPSGWEGWSTYLGVVLRMWLGYFCYNSALGRVCAREVFLNPVGNINEEPLLCCLQGEPDIDAGVIVSVMLPWK